MSQIFNISVTLDEINILVGAAAKLPYEQSVGVISNVSTQVQAQIQAAKQAEAQFIVSPPETSVE